MNFIGRKVFLDWGNQVIAVEIYEETPEAFTARTGIPFSQLNKKPFISNILDTGLGEVIEQKVGFTIANIPQMSTVTEIISYPSLFLTEQDMTDLIERTDISTEFHPDGKALGFSDNLLSYWGHNYPDREFLGFIEVPNENEHKVLYNYNTLSLTSSMTPDGRRYTPVYIFDGRKNPESTDPDDIDYEGFFFDSKTESADGFDIVAANAEKPWIVYYLGTDNASYGQRFETKDIALSFAKTGFRAGHSDNLQYFNS